MRIRYKFIVHLHITKMRSKLSLTKYDKLNHRIRLRINQNSAKIEADC